MFGLKNLVSKGVLNDDSFNALRKKSDEYCRSISYFTQHIHKIVQIYHNYYQLLEKQISEGSTQLQKSQSANQQLFVDMMRLFCGMNGELRKFVQKQASYEKALVELSDVFTNDYCILVTDLQTKGRQYFQSQQNVIENCKKYFNVYKDMMGNIEAYKNSFMDVKLIYNTQEKLKLYNQCLQNYKRLLELARLIQIKVSDLNTKKQALSQCYQVLQKQLQNFTISFASKYIEELRKFYEGLFKFQRNRLHIFSQRMMALQKSAFPSFFQTEINFEFQDMITLIINTQECKYVPCFIVYYSKIKPEKMYLFKRFMVAYYNQMTFRAEKRRRLGKKMVEFIRQYRKGLQKGLCDWIKENLNSFQKIRKKIGESFGSRWISFYKITSVIFENYLENTGRLVMRTNEIIQKLQQFSASQSSFMADFMKQLKNLIDQNVHKKIIKIYSSERQWKNQPIINEEREITQEQIYRCSISLNDLISKHNIKAQSLYEQGRQQYISFIFEIRQSLTQYFTFFNEIQNTYYDEQQYAKSYQIFQQEMSSSVQKGMHFFQEIQLSALLKENSKITFDGQFNKLQGFKKLKKPQEFQEIQLDTLRPNSQNITENRKSQNKEQLPNTKKNDEINNILNKDVFLGEVSSRHANFLLKKLTIQNGQKYIKSYSCSFSDRIILAGRLFITSHRLCFYSKFNSSNLFFGQTFIKIPKQDIVKVQKRAMSLVSDHAIEVCTRNGSMIFRSFFSRDSAFDIIRKTFQLNAQEIFFVEEQNAQNNDLIEIPIELEDDLKQQAGKERESKISKNIQEWDYTTVSEQQFTFPGLTVVKFLKLFELNQEVIINRTNYNSFLHYFKDLCQHTQVDIEEWTPNPLEYLNVVNIKEDSPEVFERKVSGVIPLPPSGIPFMPKTSLVIQQQKMHLLTGNKVVIESITNNKGVPYCETFDVRLKKVIESAGENTVKVSSYVFSNFNQKVMVQGTITAKTIQSTKQSFSKQNEQIKSYLKNLQKRMSKGNKKQTPEDKIKEQEQWIKELEGNLKQQKNEGKQLKEENEQLKKKFKMMKIVTGVLILLLILQSLLFLG